jgi:hypothetical protein
MESDYMFILGFVVNFIVAFIIIRFIYYPKKSGQHFVFTFLAFNTIVYFIMGLFTSIELSIGAGFGLFALFSILRYRTETVPIREMTYLFIMVALPILNSVLFDSGEFTKVFIIDVLVILSIWILEDGWGFKKGVIQKEVRYERIDLVKAGREEEMIEDLKKRTGLNIIDVNIDKIDFLRDVAEIRIFYTKGAADLKNGHGVPAEDKTNYENDR